MPFGAEPLVLTEDERQELEQMTQSRTLPAGDVMRSRMVLVLADGVSYQKIQTLLDTTARTIARWKRRFLQHRVVGLMEELHPGQQPFVRTAKLQASTRSDQRGTKGWFYALVVPEASEQVSCQQRHHSTDSRASRDTSASAGTLHGQRRSKL
jgi:transposase